MWSALAMTVFGIASVCLTVWLFGRESRIRGEQEAEKEAFLHETEIALARLERLRRVVGSGSLSDADFARLLHRIAARKNRPS